MIDAPEATQDLGYTGRVIGLVAGSVLALGGLISLFVCALNLAVGTDASNHAGAAVAALLTVTLGGYGADMIFRAVTGQVASRRFFDGAVGGFRAAVGVVFCALLFVAFSWVVVSETGVLAWVAPLMLASAGATFKCGAALLR